MKIFNFKNNDSRFAFIESDNSVMAYSLSGKNIKQVAAFEINKIEISLEKIKKEYPEISKANNLWILSNSRSEILTVEKAPLTKPEMFEYARWKIQDMINFPMQDVVYDILTNNSIKQPYFNKYLTAAVVKKSVRDEICAAFKNAKIPLQAIDTLQTALRDIFTLLDENNNNPIAFLNFTEKSAQISIYLEGGLILSRHVDLPRLVDFSLDPSEEVMELIFDKLILEIQRTIDLIDRQHSIQEFEHMIFSIPAKPEFNVLQEKICEYFSIKPLLKLDSLLLFEGGEHFIPVEVKACFLRGNKSSEVINLIPLVIKETSLSQDLKKVVMFASISGFLLAGIGAIYEYKARQLLLESTGIKEDNTKIVADVEKLKATPVVTDAALQKDINTLLQTKDSLLQLQNDKADEKNPLYPKFMYELAVAARSSGVYLSKVQFTQNDLLLQGYCIDKNVFSQFLQKLQASSSLDGKFLKFIALSQNLQNNNRFEFVISSNEAADNRVGGK